MIGKLIQMFIWLLLVPFVLGLFCQQCEFFWRKRKSEKMKLEAGELEKGMERLLMPGHHLVLGYILAWGIFQACAVPFIFLGYRLKHVSLVYMGICGLLMVAALVGVVLLIKGLDWKSFLKQKVNSLEFFTWDKGKRILWIASWVFFAAFLLFQLYQSFVLAYADGDDAYYISISTAANLGGSMYLLDPYTGVPTTFDARHGLAPFPIWVSFVAQRMGVNASVAAHTWIPLFLIPLTYLIYYQMGKVLLKERRHYSAAFLNVVALLQIFGNYSIYPASTFLLTRTRQGKAALGNVILPFLIYVMLLVAEEVKDNGKMTKRSNFYLFILSFAACLCSTMSGFLVMLLAGVVSLWLCIFYRRIRVLGQYLLGCVPCVFYALLYFLCDRIV